MQMIPMTMAGAAVVYSSPLVLLVCVAAWGGSTWWYGREIDRAWQPVPGETEAELTARGW